MTNMYDFISYVRILWSLFLYVLMKIVMNKNCTHFKYTPIRNVNDNISPVKKHHSPNHAAMQMTDIITFH